MGKRIPVTIRDKIATAAKDALYVCGNSDFVIEFDFDDEWNGLDVKTARFACNGQHQDVVFEGNVCKVPVLSDTHSFHVGVYAGNLHTTTPAYVSAKKSILCGSGSPAAPSPDVYAQIMERLNSIEGGSVSPEVIAAAVEAYMKEHPAGGVSPEELTAAVEAALEQAKESGEFKGDPGQQGPAGKDGKDGADGEKGDKGDKGDPGDDYILTDADKQEIAGMIPGGAASEGVYELIQEIIVADEALSVISVDNVLLNDVFVCFDSYDIRTAFTAQTLISDVKLGAIFNYTDGICGTNGRLITKYYATNDKGLVNTLRLSPSIPAAAPVVSYYTALPKVVSGYNEIRIIAKEPTGGYFPVGLRVYIYGVRA